MDEDLDVVCRLELDPLVAIFRPYPDQLRHRSSVSSCKPSSSLSETHHGACLPRIAAIDAKELRRESVRARSWSFEVSVPRDWLLPLIELVRLVQRYNTWLMGVQDALEGCRKGPFVGRSRRKRTKAKASQAVVTRNRSSPRAATSALPLFA